KLITNAEQPVSQSQKPEVSKKESADDEPSIIKSETTPQAEKPDKPETNAVGTATALELHGQTCLTTELAGIGHNQGPALDEQAVIAGWIGWLASDQAALALLVWHYGSNKSAARENGFAYEQFDITVNDMRGMPPDYSWYYQLMGPK